MLNESVTKSGSNLRGMMFQLKTRICPRTAARIWRNTEKKEQRHDPKMRRQTNLRVLVHFLISSTYVLLALCREHVIVFTLCACVLLPYLRCAIIRL